MLEKVWEARVNPFRIFGNLYFVGTTPASAHLIDTGDGLILLDSGYPQTLYLVLQSIWELGFNPADIRYIIHSHGHYDHLGATRSLVELTGAETFIGRLDADYADGTRDLTWAKELGYVYLEQFVPDHLLDDGSTITLGNTEILALHTPGHTEGTMSYFFNVSDGSKTFRAGMHGGAGMNSLAGDFLREYGLPLSLRDDFLRGLERCKSEHVDITLGNHVGSNDTLGKAARVNSGETLAFVDPSEWERYLERCKTNLLKVIENENQ